ncbi:thiol reductant ABC exporter subunit CydD [Limosilactobacillus sp.]|uniref:thiol reductant ABC exporter subunit CydD n=1 Tax=Limosilactobacillus sp. TaxID=2773925 RepID=UPI00345E2365
MIDKALFKLPGAKSILKRLVGLYVLQAVLIIGQALFLTAVLVGLWHGQHWQEQLRAMLLFALCFLGRQGINWLSGQMLSKYARSESQDLRGQLLKKVFALGPAVTQEQGTGHLVTLTLDGISNVERYIELMFSKVLVMMIVPVLILLLSFYLNWVCALIMLAVYPLIILFMILLGNAALDKAKTQFGVFTKLSNNFLDSLRGIDVLKYVGLSKRYSKSIFRSSEHFRHSTMAVLKIAMLSTFALDFFTTLSIAILAVYLGYGLIQAKLVLFPSLAILILAPEYFKPIRNFASDFHATLNGKNSFEAINKILARPNPVEPKVELHPWSANDDLELQNISFRYKHGAEIKPINAKLHGLSKIGIVGMSGSGKTTLINMIAGFLKPKDGQFVIQGHPVKEMNLAQWRSQIIYIPQSPYVFTASLRDNVAFYTPNVSDEQIKEAIHVVGLDDLVADLPQGIDTMIGSGKRVLSGGQAQRIALARAFLDRKRRILIFDEPTAHLDIETELELKQRMLPLMKDRLVIFATHRLHWMNEMDYILVMNHGQLVEQGTQQDLLAENGYFKDLVDQMRGGSNNAQ